MHGLDADERNTDAAQHCSAGVLSVHELEVERGTCVAPESIAPRILPQSAPCTLLRYSTLLYRAVPSKAQVTRFTTRAQACTQVERPVAEKACARKYRAQE